MMELNEDLVAGDPGRNAGTQSTDRAEKARLRCGVEQYHTVADYCCPFSGFLRSAQQDQPIF